MLLLCLLALAGAVDCSRILAFFPLPAKSHHFVFRPVIEELASRGHEVVYVTGFPYDKAPPNVKQVNIMPHLMTAMDDERFDMVAFGEVSVPMSVIHLYEFGLQFGNAFMSSPDVQKILHSEKEHFDAVLFESYFVQEYVSAFIHRFNTVGIEIMPLGDSSWINELSGLPDNTAAQIDFKMESTVDKLDFCGRLYNSYVTASTTLLGYFYLWRMQSVVDKYFNHTGSENMPSIFRLASNRSLVLTNSHFAVGSPVPLPPHRKEIGGINIKPNKPLPKDLQKYMDDSKHGVIYMSLGSNINVSDVTNDALREEFMAVFGSLKQNVLMKWEKDDGAKLPPNVKVDKWFPQQDILAHKNLVLFITHGGVLSLYEALHHGVPLVGIPFFGDQPKNMFAVEEAGWGRMVRYRNLTRNTISWAVNEVLNNKRYKEEAVRRSAMFRDRRVPPAQEAAYWVEYAIKYPNALTPKGATLNFFQLHRLDICALFAAIAIGLGILAFFSCCILGFICKMLCKKGTTKVKKS